MAALLFSSTGLQRVVLTLRLGLSWFRRGVRALHRLLLSRRDSHDPWGKHVWGYLGDALQKIIIGVPTAAAIFFRRLGHFVGKSSALLNKPALIGPSIPDCIAFVVPFFMLGTLVIIGSPIGVVPFCRYAVVFFCFYRRLGC